MILQAVVCKMCIYYKNTFRSLHSFNSLSVTQVCLLQVRNGNVIIDVLSELHNLTATRTSYSDFIVIAELFGTIAHTTYGVSSDDFAVVSFS